MGCRCAERKVAIRGAVASIGKGRAGEAAARLGFVARTMAEDAAVETRARISLARLALRRGSR